MRLARRVCKVTDDFRLTVNLRSVAGSPFAMRSSNNSARLSTIKSRNFSAYSTPCGERSESALYECSTTD